ncbi:MAG: hypothetical protein C0501_24885 [Isosphaera sp.]|nr:hypothetical protein [Isosphaera sp.]
MRTLLLGATAAAGLLACTSPASAQYRKTLIQNSGNGVNNTIVARGGGQPGFFPGGHPGFGHQAGYGFQDPGFGYQQPGFGYQPAGYGFPGGGFGGGGFLANRPLLGGIAKTIIQNSGNGVGNTIVAGGGHGGYGGGFGGYGGSFPGGGVFPGGVNVNVVTNSGNGAGNRVISGGGAPGGLNINVITNSGNGVGNVIKAR